MSLHRAQATPACHEARTWCMRARSEPPAPVASKHVPVRARAMVANKWPRIDPLRAHPSSRDRALCFCLRVRDKDGRARGAAACECSVQAGSVVVDSRQAAASRGVTVDGHRHRHRARLERVGNATRQPPTTAVGGGPTYVRYARLLIYHSTQRTHAAARRAYVRAVRCDAARRHL